MDDDTALGRGARRRARGARGSPLPLRGGGARGAGKQGGIEPERILRITNAGVYDHLAVLLWRQEQSEQEQYDHGVAILIPM